MLTQGSYGALLISYFVRVPHSRYRTVDPQIPDVIVSQGRDGDSSGNTGVSQLSSEDFVQRFDTTTAPLRLCPMNHDLPDPTGGSNLLGLRRMLAKLFGDVSARS